MVQTSPHLLVGEAWLQWFGVEGCCYLLPWLAVVVLSIFPLLILWNWAGAKREEFMWLLMVCWLLFSVGHLCGSSFGVHIISVPSVVRHCFCLPLTDYNVFCVVNVPLLIPFLLKQLQTGQHVWNKFSTHWTTGNKWQWFHEMGNNRVSCRVASAWENFQAVAQGRRNRVEVELRGRNWKSGEAKETRIAGQRAWEKRVRLGLWRATESHSRLPQSNDGCRYVSTLLKGREKYHPSFSKIIIL